MKAPRPKRILGAGPGKTNLRLLETPPALLAAAKAMFDRETRGVFGAFEGISLPARAIWLNRAESGVAAYLQHPDALANLRSLVAHADGGR